MGGNPLPSLGSINNGLAIRLFKLGKKHVSRNQVTKWFSDLSGEGLEEINSDALFRSLKRVLDSCQKKRGNLKVAFLEQLFPIPLLGDSTKTSHKSKKTESTLNVEELVAQIKVKNDEIEEMADKITSLSSASKKKQRLNKFLKQKVKRLSTQLDF